LNKVGCSDTICKYVDADVYPLADLPKAFSPNGDGVNDLLFVRGAGVESIDLKLYNRWGEIVFESTDISIGWDGKYKGKEAPVEAYAFVLNVTFVDGTTFFKKGNVTLLR
jgi:gliding motility-associated-like protein